MDQIADVIRVPHLQPPGNPGIACGGLPSERSGNLNLPGDAFGILPDILLRQIQSSQLGHHDGIPSSLAEGLQIHALPLKIRRSLHTAQATTKEIVG